MLGWLKRNAPPPGPPPIQVEVPKPASGERIERLLVRLGTDVHTEANEDSLSGKDAANAAAVPAAPPVTTTNPSTPDRADIVVEAGAVTEERSPGAGYVDAGVAVTPDADVAATPDVGVAGIPDADVAEIVDAAVAAIADAALKSEAAEPPPRRTTERSASSAQMRVIAVCSQKGGSGKTTLAGHLAVQAGLAGHGPAVLIDTDPQGSLAEWWRARADDAPALATVRLEELGGNLRELESYGTEIVVIDTPPALTASIEEVIAVADLVIIPARPSPHDLRAVGATVEMVRRAGKPFLFVLNGAAQRANITVQAVAALSEHGRVSPVILHQRTEYAASMIDGRTVSEATRAGKSAQEIAALWKFVHAQLEIRQAAAA